jgi:hypothetical protein
MAKTTAQFGQHHGASGLDATGFGALDGELLLFTASPPAIGDAEGDNDADQNGGPGAGARGRTNFHGDLQVKLPRHNIKHA